ncbi:type III secretion system chaperone [Spartinivicinus poritis]|uniref:Type III secretion system chaperone n=1 Tax=Spartinivicinus poritis TaxID=2994640 RepID=A0ABT5UEN4_9GAMM|nr:type III secretion system chaperone [Spartinivicinus sp. A2-2]MDE1464446.1 type III secretion system chaperone [Spartinivicinus sp. A2-2]
MKLESALAELGQRWGIPLSLKQGAIKITDKQAREWFLECPEGSEVFTIHTALNVRLTSASDFEYWLALNTNREKLSCAWVGLYEGELSLGVSFPSDLLDDTQLENLFDNMYQLKQSLISTSMRESQTTSVNYNGVFV